MSQPAPGSPVGVRPGPARRPRSAADAVLLERLTALLASWSTLSRPARPCQVIDLGGGTGTFASQLADLGYALTVIDPSPDALASLQRRADERRREGSSDGSGGRTGQTARTGSIRGLQGDAGDLVQLLGPASADVVVCHRTLEVVDDPAQAMAAVAEVVRPGGALSLVVGLRRSVVLSQALAGHLGSARRVWQDARRFDLERVESLVTGAGFTIEATEGVGAIAGYVSEALVESDPAAYAELMALERELADDPAFRALAPAVHVFARLG